MRKTPTWRSISWGSSSAVDFVSDAALVWPDVNSSRLSEIRSVVDLYKYRYSSAWMKVIKALARWRWRA